METTTTTTVMTAAAATATTLPSANSNNNSSNNTTSNTTLTTITAAAAAAAAAAPAGRSSCTTPPPVLGMLVDRTSFDETDDYGVDRVALESSLLMAQHYQNLKLNSPPRTVMKNGKVRRRMRWRPKRSSSMSSVRGGDLRDGGGGGDTNNGDARMTIAALASLAGSRASSNTITNATTTTTTFRNGRLTKLVSSSNGSVVSHVSKASQKSAHSFASTETFKKNNTKNAEFHARGYPLPRPNYPNTFDGISTINDEGNMVHARMGRGGGLLVGGGGGHQHQAATSATARKQQQQQQGASTGSPQTVFAASSLDHLSKTSAAYLQQHEEDAGHQHGMQLPPLPTSSPTAASAKLQQLQQQQHPKMKGYPPRFHANNNNNSTTRFQRNSSSSSCSTLTSMNSSAANSTTPLLQSYPLRISNTTRSRSSVSLYSGLTSNMSSSIADGCGEGVVGDCGSVATAASTAPCRRNNYSNNNNIIIRDDDDAQPLPSLESEDLLCERRVDLRIPSPAERRQTGNSSSGREHSFSSSSNYSGSGGGGSSSSSSSISVGGGGGFLPSPLSHLRSRGSEASSYKRHNNNNHHHHHMNSDCHSTCSSVSVEELRHSSASATDSAAMAAASRAALEEELALDDDPPTIVYNKNALSPSSIMSTRSKATTFSQDSIERNTRVLSKQRGTTGDTSSSSACSVATTPQASNSSTFQVKRESSSLSCSVLGYDDATGESVEDGTASCLADDESVEMNHHTAGVHHAGEMRFCMSDVMGGGGGISRSYSEPQQQQQQQPLQSNLGPASPRPTAPGDERTGPPPHHQSPSHQSKLASQKSEKEHAADAPPPGSDASPATKVNNLANQNTVRGSAAASSSTVPVDLDDGSFLDAEKNLMAIHEMAAEHLRHHEYSEALEVFEEILRGQLTRYGEDHFRVGTALHNIGIVHMKRGDYQEAVQVCREAVRIRRTALNPDHPDVAVSLAQLGVAYLECRKHKRAIVTFREALRIRRCYLGPKHPKVAKILNNIGCALYELNELEVAKVAFEEALEIQRETLRDMPFDDMDEVPDHSLLSIASTLSNIGSIKLYWGLFDEASIDLEEALLIQQSVLGDNHPLAQRTEESLDWIDTVKYSDQAAGNNNNSSLVQEPAENDYYTRGMMMCASPIEVSTTEDAEQQQSVFPGIIICSPQVGLPRAVKAASSSASAARTENLNLDNDACSSVTPSAGTGMPSLMCSHSQSDTLVRQSDDKRIRSILSVMERNLTKLRTGLGMESACGGGGGGGKDDAISTCNMSTTSEPVTHGHFSI